MRLDPAAVAAGFRLATYETLPSTNAAALHYAAERPGETDPLWITAQRQTAGRGRRGNTWASPPGNLYATLLLQDSVPPRHAPGLSFVAALAVYDAILRCAPSLAPQLALKWPNDVLCGGAKLAGILIEGSMVEARLAVAIGIGVDCAAHPAQTSYPATDLAALGVAVSAKQLFAALSATMVQRLAQWGGGDGFAAVRADWLTRAVGCGGDMRVRLPDRELYGRWEGLDDSGSLLLRRPDGRIETIAAGDVFPMTGGRERSWPQHQASANAAE